MRLRPATLLAPFRLGVERRRVMSYQRRAAVDRPDDGQDIEADTATSESPTMEEFISRTAQPRSFSPSDRRPRPGISSPAAALDFNKDEMAVARHGDQVDLAGGKLDLAPHDSIAAAPEISSGQLFT